MFHQDRPQIENYEKPITRDSYINAPESDDRPTKLVKVKTRIRDDLQNTKNIVSLTPERTE